MIILCLVQAIIIGLGVHFRCYGAAAAAFSFMVFAELLSILEKL